MLNKKQLNKCSAYIYYDGATIDQSDHIALVSYNTLICVYRSFGRVLFVGENFNCSATTRKHLSTFLKQMQIGPSYCDVRDWFKKAVDPHTGEIINEKYYAEHYGYDCDIASAFNNPLYWRGCFSAFALENAMKENRLHNYV